MKKLLLLLAVILTTSLTAETTKTTEELVAEFMKAKQEADEAKAKTAMMKAESEKIKKLGATVDKVAKELGIEEGAK